MSFAAWKSKQVFVTRFVPHFVPVLNQKVDLSLHPHRHNYVDMPSLLSNGLAPNMLLRQLFLVIWQTLEYLRIVIHVFPDTNCLLVD